jgi:hypothetical protein
VKIFKSNSEQFKSAKLYHHNQGNEINCFETNDEREVYTVDSAYKEGAIEHFFKRVVSVDAKVINNEVQYTMTNNANFKLELATCYLEYRRFLFFKQTMSYTSFRLAKE